MARSRRLVAVGVTLGVALLAWPVAASAARRQAKLTGRLSVFVRDDRSGQSVRYFLQHGDRLYALRLNARQRRSLRAGARIIVGGGRRAASIDVDPVRVLAAPRAAPVSGVRSVLVLRVFWANQDGVTPAAADYQVGGIDDAFYRENSYNQLGLTASATPWLRIPPPATCDDIDAIINSALAAAANAGINTSIYFHNMIYISSADCHVGRGWGQVPGRITVIQGKMNTYRTVHELGHNLGLWHAHSEACTAGATPVALSDTCTIDEYGDLFDVMGYVPAFDENSPSHLSAPQKNALGWLSGRSLSTDQGTYTLAPIEDQSASLHAIELGTPGHTLWLEYRQPVGVDAPLASFPAITGGVLVHETDPPNSSHPGTGSSLLDMTPGTSAGFTDATLPVGHSWTDPSGYVTVTVNSTAALGASVTIGPGPARTVVPDVLGWAKHGAATRISAAGLIPSFTGATTATTAYVATEKPAPGTIVTRGSTVSLDLKPGLAP